ncbi:MAG: helix-turn-helix domain-containing protein [Ruminococcaceae bacterium]|nr:helix-turn-helix domain-containing protein [Oscillospiraceae bacterium]
MLIKYDLPRLIQILTDFARLTGVKMNFCDSDGKALTDIKYSDDYCSHLQKDAENLIRCRCSDALLLQKCKRSKRIEMHICYAGLCDLAMPIIKHHTVVGYLIMGRIQTSLTHYKEIKGITPPPFFNDSKLESLVGLLPQILFETAIEIKEGGLISEVTDHIDKNLDGELCVGSICEIFHVSKNRLYREFHDDLGTTVNEYILTTRLKRAKKLLSESAETVYRIAELVGIPNYSYFCRVFKKRFGSTPGEYRRG